MQRINLQNSRKGKGKIVKDRRVGKGKKQKEPRNCARGGGVEEETKNDEALGGGPLVPRLSLFLLIFYSPQVERAEPVTFLGFCPRLTLGGFTRLWR
jgi:hypothetical protein